MTKEIQRAINFFTSKRRHRDMSEPLSIRLPRELLLKLSTIADVSEANRTDVMIELLERGLSTFAEDENQ